MSDNYKSNSFVEFILVDFASDDGLKEWILATFVKELDLGYLRYYYTEELKNWNASIAKNTSHLYASGEFVMNLDCDNFTGPDGALFVLKQLERFGDNLLLHQFSGNLTDGSFGRIGSAKSYFLAVGGYDETFAPMGYQDVDLINRLCEFGLNYVNASNPLYNKAIINTKTESVQNTNSNMTWEEMDAQNLLISTKNYHDGKIVVNNGKIGIQVNVMAYAQNLLTFIR